MLGASLLAVELLHVLPKDLGTLREGSSRQRCTRSGWPCHAVVACALKFQSLVGAQGFHPTPQTAALARQALPCPARAQCGLPHPPVY